MERMLLRDTKGDRKQFLDQGSNIASVTANRIKWRWAGHNIGRTNYEGWSKITTEWQPLSPRNFGRPRARWRDEIVSYVGSTTRQRYTQNRNTWHS